VAQEMKIGAFILQQLFLVGLCENLRKSCILPSFP